MDTLLSLDRELVISELHILWPLSGDLWFDTVVEAMTAAGILYAWIQSGRLCDL
jgi:hypothetical protein